MRESLVFPRAASVTSWTVPAHISLFTGLYPWESGAHAKRDLRLRPEIPRLAERLRGSGYRSIALSANPVVLPTFGMVNGFDCAYWAAWWEPFVRANRTTPGTSYDARQPVESFDYDHGLGPVRHALLQLSPNLHRAPYMMDGLSRVVQKIQSPGRPRDLTNVPWIEKKLGEWLNAQPAEVPTFTFVNLLEAHEPYYTDDEIAPTFRDWLRYARVRQDHFSCATGQWTPSEHELAELHRMYRRMIRVIDKRLDGIVEEFKRAGRWDNTVMVLTSDHGQAFGEHGIIFHTLRVDEEMTRIPLWIRFPNGVHAGESGVGWASLIDVFPTFLKAAGIDDWKTPSGYDLGYLADNQRHEPLFTMSDGLIWTHVDEMLAEERRSWLDRVFVAAYQSDRKVVVNAVSGEASAFAFDQDPLEVHDILPDEADRLEPLVEDAKEVGRRLLSQGAPLRSQAVEERLKSWGYV